MLNAITHNIYFEWIFWIIGIIYAVTILGVIGVILSENRNPIKSLAWVTILLLFPVLGLVLYAFFGRSIKNTTMISRRNRRRLQKKDTYKITGHERINLSQESWQQINLARRLANAWFYTGNSVEIFTNGRSKFDALKRDLRGAEKYIHLQYYIFENDKLGNEIKDILIAKAHEGVKIKVIYDHVGSFNVKNRFFQEMREHGIMVYPFFRVSFPPFATRINWRNHRKLCIIDGKIGYIGGMNIADRYIDGGNFSCWRDTHLRITGPAINGLQYSFAVDWNFMKQPFIEESVSAEKALYPERADAVMQMMTSGPTSEWSNIAMVFLKAIANAKHSILLQTPYFLPTESLLKALESAALSNVNVKIMIPRHSDSSILKYASFSYIQECLDAKIKFYLYEPGMLHSKVLIIDEEFSSVGSTNFDFRSFEYNFEGNMFIYSTSVNARLREIFAEDQKHCSTVNRAKWKKRSIGKKIAESITRLLSPIL